MLLWQRGKIPPCTIDPKEKSDGEPRYRLEVWSPGHSHAGTSRAFSFTSGLGAERTYRDESHNGGFELWYLNRQITELGVSRNGRRALAETPAVRWVSEKAAAKIEVAEAEARRARAKLDRALRAAYKAGENLKLADLDRLRQEGFAAVEKGKNQTRP